MALVFFINDKPTSINGIGTLPKNSPIFLESIHFFIHKIVFEFLAKFVASLFTTFIPVASTESNKPAAK